VDHLLDATYRAERTHFWFHGLRQFSEPLVTQALAGRTTPRILDCGFGTGANMARLSARGRVWGFDLSTVGVPHARAYGQTTLAQASLTAIPFPESTFDLVTAFDVLACLDEPHIAAALTEVRRVLKPNGAFFFNTAALPILRGSHAVFGQEVYRATKGSLGRRLEESGFRIDRLTYTNCSLFPLMLAVRLSQRAFGLSSPEESGADIVVPPAWINAILAGVLSLEAQALRVMNMPFGSSLLGLATRTS
jgi:ubiquinone/menaquinone biosynthesis C-methylase UbiE